MTIIAVSGTNIFTRLVGAGSSALVITFALFVVMDKLTSNDSVMRDDVTPIKPLTLWYQEKPETPPARKELPRPKPEIKQPPTTPELPDDRPQLSDPGGEFIVEIPRTDLSKNGYGDGAMSDLPAQPIVRMQPEYPSEAARDGIEGWVKLIFSIDASGQVKDIQVLDSKPKRVFDRAARRALSKWKYKPQMIAGKPVSEEGLQIVLDFTLDKS